MEITSQQNNLIAQSNAKIILELHERYSLIDQRFDSKTNTYTYIVDRKPCDPLPNAPFSSCL